MVAGYYLWALERVIMNKPTDEIENTKPAKWYESVPVTFLALLALIFGLFPQIIWYVLDEWSRSVLPA